MHTIYFLIGALASLMALLFLSLIALIWGLRQLLLIRNQNDTMISLMEQIFESLWSEDHIQDRLQEDNEGTALTFERDLKLNRQIQG
jgi:hypothetical protein